MRWAMVMAAGLPALLALAALFAKLGGGNADRPLRLLRYVVAAELIALLVVAAVGYVYEHRARARDAQLYKPPGRLIDVGGYRLHLNCMGQGGPTVVLEYGLEGSYIDWRKVQPEIAGFSRVCAYDRAGYGWSDASRKARVPSVMANELHTLLCAAGEKGPYIVVAHSYGSLVGRMFAYKFPSETAGLVLVDGLHVGPTPWFPVQYRAWLRFLQWTSPLGLPRWRGWCSGGPLELRGAVQAANCRPRVFAACYKEHSELPESGAELRSITTLGSVPLIVITRDPAMGHDREEEVRHASEQRDVLALSSQSRLIIAEGSGHDVPGMRPDVIVEAVRSLITKSRAPAGSLGTP